MKKLGSFMNKSTLTRKSAIDEKSVFFIFEMIIKEEYGKQGIKNIKMISFRERKLLVKTENSNWTGEIFANRSYLIKKINDHLGGEEIMDIAISN